MSDEKSDRWRSERDDGRHRTTEGFVHEYIKDHEPELSFDAGMSGGELEAWQREVKEKLYDLLTFPEFEEEQPEPKQLWSKPRDGYTVQKWEAFPEPKSVVPFLLLVPDQASPADPHPTVFCYPGSSKSKEYISGEEEADGAESDKFRYNQMARHFAKEGYIAIAVENPITGELVPEAGDVSRGERREIASANLIGYGRNYVGVSVYQKRRIIEWAKTLEMVDTDRLAVSGHSLGTEPAAIIGVLDDDIDALIFNDVLIHHRNRVIAVNRPSNPYNDGGGIWHLIPEFYRWFDFPDLLAAFAPRKLFIGEGGVPDHIETVRKAYDILEKEENMSVFYYDEYELNPEKTGNDVDGVPEGMSMNEWREYANYPPRGTHAFKEFYALPWLAEEL